MNKHSEPHFKKVTFHPRDDKFFEYLHYTPQNTLSLGVAGKEILTLSAL